jgi:hypothetical protein
MRDVYNGTAGNAVATAIADASGTATAKPYAVDGNGGPRPDQRGAALAIGSAIGKGGIIPSIAIDTNLFSPNRAAEAEVTNPLPANAPGRAAANNQAEATIHGPAPAPPNGPLQGLAIVVGAPLRSDVQAAAVGDPVVTQFILKAGHTVLGLNTLGGQYVDLETGTPGVFEPAGTAGPSVTSTSSALYTLDAYRLSRGDLELGLLGSTFTGSGFDSLEFRVIEGGATILDRTFTDPFAATGYFDDHVLDLGSPTGGSSGSLDLEFDLILTTSKVGDGFSVAFLDASVPEPSSLALLAGASVALAWLSLRRAHAGRR